MTSEKQVAANRENVRGSTGGGTFNRSPDPPAVRQVASGRRLWVLGHQHPQAALEGATRDLADID